MFKRYADFSSVHGTDQHPGQPVHCGTHCDVWHKDGKFVLFPRDGEALTFDSLNAAQEHGAKHYEEGLRQMGERAVRESWAAAGRPVPDGSKAPEAVHDAPK